MTTRGIPVPTRGGQAGVTLIESLIAMAVLTVGLLGLFVLHHTAQHANSRAYRFNVATLLAQDGLEYLSTLTFTAAQQSPMLDPAGFGTDTTSPSDQLPDLGGHFPGESAASAINAWGNTTSEYGSGVYYRSYRTDYTTAGDDTRLTMTVRVTFDNPATGSRQGVTLSQTRSYDTYQP